MATQKKHSEKKRQPQGVVSSAALNETAQEINTSHPLSLINKFSCSFPVQALLLIVIGLAIYSNSFLNEYALDDGIVIQKNEYVQQGIRGIPKILSTDAYDSFYKQMNARQQLSGGRYRPLSVVTFALEQEIFGTKKAARITDNSTEATASEPKTLTLVRHILNVLFYILSVVILLYFMHRFIFSEAPIIAFITALLFLIHPIHTEVVANIKSRDEILSFLFIILTFTGIFKYRQTRLTKHLIWALVSYFLALLSKEYAITLIVLIPMLLYVKEKSSIKESVIATVPFMLVAFVYLYIRFSIVGKGGDIDNPDVLNNPFKFATDAEKWATKIEILNHYLRLLFIPHPLSSDYSFNTIPYVNFANWKVWMSIVIHISMISATIVLFFKRNILSFALAFYLLHLVLVSNLFMDLGATMGERLIYHSSLGFLIVVAVVIHKLLNNLHSQNIKNIVGIGLGIVVTGWCSARVVERNTEWKNDASLFIADAQTVPNSALVNGNAGKAYIDMSEKPENKAQEKELIKKAIYHLDRSIKIHKEYVNGYLNIGVAYFKLGDYDKAREHWETAKRIYPNNPFLKRNLELMGTVYFNDAMKMGRAHPDEARKLLEKAVEVDPYNAEYWYNLGGVNFTIGNYEKARTAWERTLKLNPNKEDAKRGMAAIPVNKK
ncbi:MAG: tetratricopeptide repeat protein [Bacteroidia bacterium]|jgi:tetratricopeptide (TPR) repeat protein